LNVVQFSRYKRFPLASFRRRLPASAADFGVG
jgi:hypothetical protein